jgi:hypothetical protein
MCPTNTSAHLIGWVDPDFAADLDTRRSHTGYILMLNWGAVSWKSTKQKSVSLSTGGSEWYTASEAGKEIVYLRSILNGFGLEQVSPTLLYEDSRAVIAENPVTDALTKVYLFQHLRSTKQKC